MAAQRLVKLSSATGEIFEVEEAVAVHSQLVRNVVEDVGVESPIPLPNVSSYTLGKVLEYCKRYVENKSDAKFIKVDMHDLHNLTMAANYMHIETLLELIYHNVAMMIDKKTLGKILQIFSFTKADWARGEGHLMGKKSLFLASFLESLPMELGQKIKMKVAQRFHHDKCIHLGRIRRGGPNASGGARQSL